MNKLVLITGGTKGIGKAIAFCLGRAGYDLILTYALDQVVADEVRTDVERECGVKVHTLKADISKDDTITEIDSYIFLSGIHF